MQGLAMSATGSELTDIFRNESHWSTLVGSLRAGQCTPVIGAGACYPVLPTGAALSRAIAQANPGYPYQDIDHLARVAQFMAARACDAVAPKIAVKEVLDRSLRPHPSNGGREAQPTALHRALALARLPLYVTTNYDGLMEQALNSQGVQVVSETCRWNRQLLENLPSEYDTGYRHSKDRPAVFHLHGKIESVESMVLTEDDYLDFLVNMGRDLSLAPESTLGARKSALPLPVRRALSDTSLLFVGYSLADINFRVILRTLASSLDRSNRRLSVTMQLPPHAGMADPQDFKQRLEEYYRWTLDLHVGWADADGFAAELLRRMNLI